MKKIILALLCVSMSLTASAQYTSKGGFKASKESVYYGVRLGLYAHKTTKDYSTDMKAGINVGGAIGLRLSQTTPVFLESGLYFNMKGGKDGDLKVTLPYLEIPVLVKYGIGVGNDMAVLPFFGPYFGIGVGSGKIKYGDAKGDAFGDVFKRFDAGLKLGCGFEYNMLYAELGWNFGLANIVKDDVAQIGGFKVKNDATSHNSGLFLNVGVNF